MRSTAHNPWLHSPPLHRQKENLNFARNHPMIYCISSSRRGRINFRMKYSPLLLQPEMHLFMERAAELCPQPLLAHSRPHGHPLPQTPE